MPAPAARLAGVTSTRGVLLQSDGFKVPGVDATSVKAPSTTRTIGISCVAEMVKVESVRNRTNRQLVRHAMRSPSLATRLTNQAVAVAVDTNRPQQATTAARSDMTKESELDGAFQPKRFELAAALQPSLEAGVAGIAAASGEDLIVVAVTAAGPSVGRNHA